MGFSLSSYETALGALYGSEHEILTKHEKRFKRLIQGHVQKFGKNPIHLFSTPGRTELSGNHTDHNHGRVLAASVSLDSIAAASKNETEKVVLYSEGYDEPFEVNLKKLDALPGEKEKTGALIRGIAARFRQLGYEIGGFSGMMTSEVLPGSGLSSSASVEVLIGSIFNALYNDNSIAPEELAKIGQFAENKYFGKPCGLMDQMACAVGGIIAIDFNDPQKPIVEKVDFDFAAQQYSLLVVDTGGNHADLTKEYASVPKEMKAVANALGKEVCREIDNTDFVAEIKSLRPQVGDRAVLRALHFIAENERVQQQVAALRCSDFQKFLDLVKDSGNSSFKWLQNIYSIENVQVQGVALALALTEIFIANAGAGACRVHGGGFAGTIQVFLPNEVVENYIHLIESVFGEGKVMVLSIRPYGTVYLDALQNK